MPRGVLEEKDQLWTQKRMGGQRFMTHHKGKERKRVVARGKLGEEKTLCFLMGECMCMCLLLGVIQWRGQN